MCTKYNNKNVSFEIFLCIKYTEMFYLNYILVGYRLAIGLKINLNAYGNIYNI